MRNLIILMLIATISGCTSNGHNTSIDESKAGNKKDEKNKETIKKPELSDKFGNYWYSGKAELNKYNIKQARYGEIHKGKAVLVFVTEDFLVNKQVKKEKETSKKSTTILKLNNMRNFTTGIYDYNIMTSIFTPIKTNKYPHSLKMTTSSQDWCGQVFMQLNNRDKYDIKIYSYFQKEGDKKYKLDKTWLEDELWTMLRISPSSLPTGNIKIIPSGIAKKLTKQDFKIYSATASIMEFKNKNWPGNNLMAYELEYKKPNRTLKIIYSSQFPYDIVGWTDKHVSGFGKDKKILTTKATRSHKKISEYWSKNTNKDIHLRDSLGLE